MASDAGLALQTKYYSLLNGNINVSGVIPVYDDPPSGATYPYIQIGGRTATDYVTKTTLGEEATQTVFIVDRFQGSAGNRDTIYAIASEVKDIIRARPVFDITDWNVVTATLDNLNFTKEKTDTYTYWVLEVRFRHKLEQL